LHAGIESPGRDLNCSGRNEHTEHYGPEHNNTQQYRTGIALAVSV
jgi:hypothetical protein